MGLEKLELEGAEENIRYYKLDGKIISISLEDTHISVDEVVWNKDEEIYEPSKGLGSIVFKQM